MLECVSFTLTTLQSLLQLLDEVKNMVISDDIQQEVTMATVLDSLYKTYPIYTLNLMQCVCLIIYPQINMHYNVLFFCVGGVFTKNFDGGT